MSKFLRVGFFALSFGLLAGCNGDGIFSDGEDGDDGAGGDDGGGGSGGGVVTQQFFYAFNESLDLVEFRLGALSSPKVITTTGITGKGSANPPLLRSIDVRPGTSQIYALFSDKRLYTINRTTGAATLVGTLPVAGSTINGMDWNPVPDRLRVLVDNRENYRFNGATLENRDTDLAYVSGDPQASATPSPGGVAYAGDSNGPTTAYMLDSTANTLVRLGGPGGTPSPNAGQLTTVGPLGVGIGGAAKPGFDIDTRPSTDVGYILDIGTANNTLLYSVNLATGTAASSGALTGRFSGLTILYVTTSGGGGSGGAGGSAGSGGAGGSGGSGGTGGAGGSAGAAGSSGTLLHDDSVLGPVVDPLDEALVTPISDAGASVILEPLADAVLNPLLDALGAQAPGSGGTGGSGGAGGSGGGGGTGTCVPGDPTGMLCASQLCAVPGIGPALAEAAGASCGGGGGGGGGDTCVPGDPTGMLCASQLCAIPTLGPELVAAVGGSCTGGGGGGGGGGGLPLDPAPLCAIPVIGPAIVEGAGSSCGGGGGGGGGSPLSPAALCAIPGVGPQLAGAAGATCP